MAGFFAGFDIPIFPFDGSPDRWRRIADACSNTPSATIPLIPPRNLIHRTGELGRDSRWFKAVAALGDFASCF